ncbi:MAG: carboxypeptidase-like regulatory domain-containing protein [Patescibacteria group bacterium]
MKQQYINAGLTVVLLLAGVLIIPGQLDAYAPPVNGRVIDATTGKPIEGVWVEWDVEESGCYKDGKKGQCYASHLGQHQRYASTGSDGSYRFEKWDSQGIDYKDNAQDSTSKYGSTEYQTMIDLDYDPNTGSEGKEARQATSQLFDLFNCNSESHAFSLRLPPELEGATVTGRWRNANQADGWSQEYKDTVVLITGEDFDNNNDYIVEFVVDMPKSLTSRELSGEEMENLSIGDSQLQEFEGSLAEIESLQDFNPAQYKKSPVCVASTVCTEENGSSCSANDSRSGSHRVRLNGVGEKQRKLSIGNPELPIWLVECVQSGSAESPTYTCTTGNNQIDDVVFGSGNQNLEQLQAAYGYQANLFFEDGETETSPEISQDNRRDTYEWVTTINRSTKEYASVFMAMYIPDAASAVESGDNRSQQQATLDFADGCNLVIDPYGKTFDSITMEPLSGVTVELSKERTDGSFQLVKDNEMIADITNPQITEEDGAYSFLVSNGTYRLTVVKPGYQFLVSTLNPLAYEMYADLYDGGDIVVEDEMVEKNIPLEPKDVEAAIAYAKSNPIEFVNHFQSIDKKENIYTIQGTVSHPLAEVEVYAAIPNKRKPGDLIRTRTLGRVVADNDGMFILAVDLSNLKEGEIIGELSATKKQIDTSSYQSGMVEQIIGLISSIFAVSADTFEAGSATIELSPVLNYVEGYAVSSGGLVSPGAMVSVSIPSSDIPVHQVQADEDGYFRITSEYLPPVPYEIEYESLSKNVSTVSTRTFIAENAALDSGASQYFAFRPSDENAAVLGDYTTFDDIDFSADPNDLPAIAKTTKPDGVAIILAVFLMVSIIVGTSLTGLYITQYPKRKKRI